jgi:hypothetical protein
VSAAAEAVDLTGTVDLHVHSSPDVKPRYADDLTIVREARTAGMRAVLLKSHVTLTADRAAIAESIVPGIRVLGGLVLNHPVGGLNPAAVETALQLGARCIWLPTLDAANHRSYYGDTGGIAVLDEHGNVLPVVLEIAELISAADAVLATGHLSVAQTMTLVPAVRAAGLERVLITHPDTPFVAMPVDAQLELAGLGAFLERTFIDTTPKHGALGVPFVADRIRTVGVGSTVLTTDFGQPHNPPPVAGLRQYLQELRGCGISEAELQQMAATTPAQLIGLT